MKLSYFPIYLMLINLTAQAEELNPNYSTDPAPINYYLDFPINDLPATHALNPAWLRAEQRDQTLYRIVTSQERGNWHLPFEPYSRLNCLAMATGTQSLNTKQLFTGSFGYRYQLLEDKLWVHNRNPYTGNPFLFGDSTLGGFNLRGLFWEVGYSNQWSQNWFSGLALFYNVDEEYKTVFPKSQIKHRDLQLRLASGWQSESNRLGLCISYFDFQEIMETTPYTLEQDKTPIFVKVRATDNPLLAHGQTSEERLFAIQGFNLTLDGRWQHGRRQLAYQAGAEKAQAQNVDGGAYPVAQGRWYVTRLFFHATLSHQLGRSHRLELFSTGNLNSQTADHPEIQQEIYALRMRRLTGGLSGCFCLNERWGIIPSFHYTSSTYKRTDYYNGNLQYFPQTLLGYSQQFVFRTQSGTQLALKGGFSSYAARSRLYSERQDWYYQAIITQDISYYQTGTTTYWTEIHWQIPAPNRQGCYAATLRYFTNRPNSPNQHSTRDCLTFNLSLGR